MPLDTDYLVLITGNSSGARLMVGPLVVWTGVRKDVSWDINP